MAQAEKLIPAHIAARRLGVKPKTVRRWARTGFLRAVRWPGGWRIPEGEILRVRTVAAETSHAT